MLFSLSLSFSHVCYLFLKLQFLCVANSRWTLFVIFSSIYVNACAEWRGMQKKNEHWFCFYFIYEIVEANKEQQNKTILQWQMQSIVNIKFMHWNKEQNDAHKKESRTRISCTVRVCRHKESIHLAIQFAYMHRWKNIVRAEHCPTRTISMRWFLSIPVHMHTLYAAFFAIFWFNIHKKRAQ